MKTSTNPGAAWQCHIISAHPKTIVNLSGRSVIEQARSIRKSLGTYTAARYLAKRGWSIEAARFALLGVS